MTLSSGQLLAGRYRILRLLGQGGMGAVYLAEDVRLPGRQVAVKENFDPSLGGRGQFEREAIMLARLKHPSLPQVTDHFVLPSGEQYLVMEYVAGESLDEILARRGAPPEAEVLGWIDQVMDALEYMHTWVDPVTGQSTPVIHRDIKPANIKLTLQGKIVLVDFGIAKYQTASGTMTGARAASPGFSPVEQYVGGTDARSDIYALGATLYTLLTGQVPPESPAIAAGALLTPPRILNPTVSPKIEQSILRAMRLQAADRYQSVSEFRHDLFGIPVAVQKMPRGRLWGMAAVGLFAVMLLVLGQLVVSGIRRSMATPTLTVAILPTATSSPSGGAFAATLPALTFTPPPPALTSIATEVVTLPPPTLVPEQPTATAEPTQTPTPTSTWTATPLPGQSQGKIVFVSNRDGNNEIYVMEADGSRQTRLTKSPGDDWSPAWSPDGERIAFTSTRRARMAGVHNIFVMDADGSNVQQLTRNQAWDEYAAWSPDGRQIAFTSTADNNAEIFVVNADGSSPRRLTFNTADDAEPSWSPDGQRIMFTSRRTGAWQILTMDTTGNNQVSVTSDDFNYQHPVWSPDGHRIAVFSDRDGNAEIYVMNDDGSGLSRLTRNDARDEHPSWSPDGSAIAFLSSKVGSASDVYIMWADGSQPTRLTSSAAADGAPDWGRLPGSQNIVHAPSQPTPTPCWLDGVFQAVWSAHRAQLGCPIGSVEGTTVTIEPFTGGVMLWIKANDQIYVLPNGAKWSSSQNTWKAGDDPFTCDTARTIGLPVMGFGRVWCMDAQANAQLGRPLSEEIPDDNGKMQTFDKGQILRGSRGQSFILYDDGSWAGP
jgi:eukaryotic-like serine/threonine-protein kinase